MNKASSTSDQRTDKYHAQGALFTRTAVVALSLLLMGGAIVAESIRIKYFFSTAKR